MMGQDSLPSVLGPLSNSLSGVKMFMKAVLSQQPWKHDPESIRRPWDEDVYQLKEHGGGRKLVFGMIWNDGMITPHPPIIRGLEQAKKALIAAGHEVVDWLPYKHDELYHVTVCIKAALP
jgi:amidase